MKLKNCLAHCYHKAFWAYLGIRDELARSNFSLSRLPLLEECQQTPSYDITAIWRGSRTILLSQAISSRLLCGGPVSQGQRPCFVEQPPGWFKDYEREWIGTRLVHTVKDPRAGDAHPTDRMEFCGLALVDVNKNRRS